MKLIHQEQRSIDHLCGYTAGHFDGHPIVPGAVSLQWMMEALGKALNRCTLEAATLSNLKCLAELAPPCDIRVDVYEKPGGRHCIQLLQQEQLMVSVEVRQHP
jgi:3-hydroxymyristoyl/3-hydroxydecanoyl-(acyl carrier protein) dehydratase